MTTALSSAQVVGDRPEGSSTILTEGALSFLAALHRRFEPQRQALLSARAARQASLHQGARPTMAAPVECAEGAHWTIWPVPPPLERRHVEITGPTDAKMIINALNSGADVFMADLEDATSPTWRNIIEGQLNLMTAVRGELTYEHPSKGVYRLQEQTALLLVRPRGWHLPERHLEVDGQPMSASLVDFGLYVFHNAHALIERGVGPYLYLPKLESAREAALWDEVFVFTQEQLGLELGTIKATILLENILLSFELDEAIYALRRHLVGVNAGRWDYIFSAIKKLHQGAAPFPDRGQITMQAPFMKAYTELLVQTCHRRGAHAIGGMAAFIPSRDPEVNARAFAQVRADKEREARDGFDGTWVAHPGLVELARQAFDAKLQGRPHQKDVLRPEVQISAQDLLRFEIPGGQITEAGLRLNVSVGLRYVAAWLCGTGAVALHDLMEDAATAEISRTQIWHWLHTGAITRDQYQAVLTHELDQLRAQLGPEAFARGRFQQAAQIFDEVAAGQTLAEFLTLVAYPHLEG